MRSSLTTKAGLALAVTLISLPAAGCHGKSASPAATSEPTATASASQSAALTSAPTQPSDLAELLIRADDLNAPEAFTATSTIRNPDGREGVSTTFRNEDSSHVIVDTILILPDAAAATAALDAARDQVPGSAIGAPAAIDIGTGGTHISGESADGTQSVTILRFTRGRAFVTLEFDGPAGQLAPPDFVTDVGQKQDAAVKRGLPG